MRACVACTRTRPIIFPGYTFTTDDRVAFQRRSTLSTGQIYATPCAYVPRNHAAGHSRPTARSNASANAPTYCLPVAIASREPNTRFPSHRVLALETSGTYLSTTSGTFRPVSLYDSGKIRSKCIENLNYHFLLSYL